VIIKGHRCQWSNRKGWGTLSSGAPAYCEGKFLFFCPSWQPLMHVAEEEVLVHGFAVASIPHKPWKDYVLCLFAPDDRLDSALHERFVEDYKATGVKYVGWKPSKGITWQGCTLTPEQQRESHEAFVNAYPDKISRKLPHVSRVTRFSSDAFLMRAGLLPDGLPEHLDEGQMLEYAEYVNEGVLPFWAIPDDGDRDVETY
jgi:hypothetical protein